VLEVRGRPVELTKSNKRLDRIGPDGKRRIVNRARDEPFRKLAQRISRDLELTQHELHTTEDRLRQDRVQLDRAGP
jgi:hypothetical protein